MLLYEIIGLYFRNMLHQHEFNHVQYIKEINKLFSNNDYIELFNKIKSNLNKEEIEMLNNPIDNHSYTISDISYTINQEVLEYYESHITVNFLLFVINEVLYKCDYMFYIKFTDEALSDNVCSAKNIFCFILNRLDKQSIKFCSDYLIDLHKQNILLFLNKKVEILSILELFNNYIDLSYFLDNDDDYQELIFNRDN